MSVDTFEKFILVLGTNGTGKTTLNLEIMAAIVKRGGRVLIVMPDDSEYDFIDYVDFKNEKAIKTFTGIKKTVFDPEYTNDNIVNHLKNCTIFFEDCMSYYGNSLPMNLHRMLIRRRQYHINVIAVGHGFTEMPPKFFTFATDYILFLTEDNIYKRKNDIKSFDVVLAATMEIAQKAKTNRHYHKYITRYSHL